MTLHTPSFAQVQVGETLPELQLPPVDRTTLALFAGASGDHNPMHIDIDVARRAGAPDVFAHGRVVEKLQLGGENCVRIELHSSNQFGQTKIVGEALVALA